MNKNNNKDAKASEKFQTKSNLRGRNGKRKQKTSKSAKISGRTGNIEVSNFDGGKDIHDNSYGNNDPSWYNKHIALAHDSASLPYMYQAGVPFDIDGPVNYKTQFTSPGLITITLYPSIGYTDNVTSPVNSAARILYNQITGAKSGTAKFDAPDIMMYQLALASIYEYVCFLQRAYGLINVFSNGNRYMPRTIFKAMGLDYDSWTSDLSNFRFQLNNRLAQLMIWPTASNMPLFKRAAWKYSNIYTEGQSIKDQLYMYVPDGFYEFHEDLEAEDYATSLLFKSWSLDANASPDYCINYLDELMAPLLQSASVNYISGWLLAYYGSYSLNSFAALVEGYTTLPIYSPEVLYQFKNATIVPVEGLPLLDTEVKQDPTKGYIICKPYTLTTSGGWEQKALEYIQSDHILESGMDVPTGDDNIINTRMMVFGRKLDNTNKVYLECFMDIPTHCYVYNITDEYGTSNAYEIAFVSTMNSINGEYRKLNSMRALALSSNFKFHPVINVLNVTEDTSTDQERVEVYRFWDVDNFTAINVQQLRNLNQTCLMSIFDLPTFEGSVEVKPSYR